MNDSDLRLIRHNTMALVHYGFSREEALWMPLPEVQDYVLLINQQIEEENEQLAARSAGAEKPDAPTISDVFRGEIR